jgi:hypothetical protein
MKEIEKGSRQTVREQSLGRIYNPEKREEGCWRGRNATYDNKAGTRETKDA